MSAAAVAAARLNGSRRRIILKMAVYGAMSIACHVSQPGSPDTTVHDSDRDSRLNGEKKITNTPPPECQRGRANVIDFSSNFTIKEFSKGYSSLAVNVIASISKAKLRYVIEQKR